MGANLIIFTGIIYLYIGLDQFYKGNTGMCIAYIGYSFSNIGLYLVASK